jgi:hypothetical protein
MQARRKLSFVLNLRVSLVEMAMKNASEKEQNVQKTSGGLPRDVTRFQKFTANGVAPLPKGRLVRFEALTTIERIAKCKKIRG